MAQLEDFISTIDMVTSTDEDDFTSAQKEKVRLLSEYRSDIDELLDAAETLRERAVDEWPTLFQSQLDDDLWTNEWNIRRDDKEYGLLYRHEWYRDDEDLAPTTDYEATWGDRGFRLHFAHMIRQKRSFARGELTYSLICPTSVPLRDEFNELYNSDRGQDKLRPLLEERNITNKGNKRVLMTKTYDVDQSRLSESYFETLATAFEEHLPIAEEMDNVLVKACQSLESD